MLMDENSLVKANGNLYTEIGFINKGTLGEIVFRPAFRSDYVRVLFEDKNEDVSVKVIDLDVLSLE